MSDAYTVFAMKKCIAQICKKMGVEFISERALDTLCDVAITCKPAHCIP